MFVIVNFLLCITVAKGHCYAQLKIKPSRTIVHYYVLREEIRNTHTKTLQLFKCCADKFQLRVPCPEM
jgi:hypothetical protein